MTFTAPKVGAMTTYTDTGSNAEPSTFTIEVPKNWTRVGGKIDASCKGTICFTAPEQQGQIPAMIMVNVSPEPGTSTLQTAWKWWRQLQIDSWGAKPKTAAGTRGDVTLAGQPGKEATYTIDWGLIPATMQQKMTLSGMTTVMVTVISATDIWDGLQPTFTASFDSFTLTTG